MENWKNITEFPNYQISDMGRVRRSTTGINCIAGTVISQRITKGNGYYAVNLYNHDGRHTKYVHRLVLENFVNRPSHYVESAHNDGNKLNNSLSNLRWATRKENALDKRRHGTQFEGEMSPRSKLTEVQVMKIRHMRSVGYTYPEISKKTKVPISTLYHILNHNTWRHVK